MFGIAFNMWLNLNATVEATMDYHISNYDTNPHDIDYVQEEVSSQHDQTWTVPVIASGVSHLS
jgi:hypothetical protein